MLSMTYSPIQRAASLQHGFNVAYGAGRKLLGAGARVADMTGKEANNVVKQDCLLAPTRRLPNPFRRDICVVLQVFLLQNYSCATNGCKSGGAASSPSEAGGKRAADKRALDTCRTLLTRRGLESTGAIPCVSPSCGNWMVHEGGGQRVKCGSCLVEFCGRSVYGLRRLSTLGLDSRRPLLRLALVTPVA